MHGEFVFTQQRFKFDGQECTYFELTNQCHEGNFSSGLQELSAYYSNRMSYEEVEKLIISPFPAQTVETQTFTVVVNPLRPDLLKDSISHVENSNHSEPPSSICDRRTSDRAAIKHV